MSIKIVGTLVVLLLVTVPLVNFLVIREKKSTLSLLLIVVLGAFLRLFVAADNGLHDWDERYHALVAKNMKDNPFKPTLYKNPVLPYDYKNWTENHVWLHKQPMTLWLMAGSMSVFGVNEFGVRFPSILLTTLGILMIFSMVKILWSERVALIAAFFYAIHGLMLEQIGGRTTTDHIDVTFLFFIQLAIYLAVLFFQKKHFIFNVLCGVAIGLALITKWLPALIVLPIWLVLAWGNSTDKKSLILNFLILVSCMAIVALPWQFYIYMNFPNEAIWESQYNFRHLFEPIEDHGKSWFYYLNLIRELFGELIYLPIFWLIYAWIKQIRNYQFLVLLIWIIVPLLVFSFASTKMQGYILFSAPAYFITTALFIEFLLSKIKIEKTNKWLLVPVVLLVALPIRYSIERIKPFDNYSENFKWAEDFRHLNSLLPNQEKTVVFNCERYIEFMFYTDCVAYPFDVSFEKRVELEKQGFTVLENIDEAFSPFQY